MKTFWISILGMCLALGSAAESVAADLTAKAILQPETLQPGQTGTLVVEVGGSTDPQVTLPKVDGVEFGRPSIFRQTQWNNFQKSSATKLTFPLRAAKPGTYALPPVVVQADGRTTQTAPLELRVLAPAPVVPAPAPAPAGPGTAPQGPSTAPADGMWLDVRPVRTRIFVGEVLPLDIRVGFDASQPPLQVGQPVFIGSDWIMEKQSSDPTQFQEQIDGVTYLCARWSAATSAFKTGTFPLQARLPVQLAVRDVRTGDPWFDRMLNMGRTRTAELQSGAVPIEVRPLPTEGRPAGFDGAVGRFELRVTPPSGPARAGDPVKFILALEGRGNFERVTAPQPETLGGWKTYTPESTFTPLDVLGIQGVKSFELVMVPESDQVRSTPTFQFSYFDPEKERYVTLRSDPVPFVVEPVGGKSPGVSPASATTATPGSRLAPPWDRPTRVHSALRPAWNSVVFLVGCALVLMVLATAATLTVLALRSTPERRMQTARRREEERLWKEVERCASEGRAVDFFEAARSWVQNRLGHDWGVPAGSLTPADLRQRGHAHADAFQTVLETAEAIRFAGRKPGRDEMQISWETLRSIRKELRE